jgi:uncharacterized protein
MSAALLAVLFGVTAAIYASVGFGGGSTYTALLIFSGVAVSLVPILSLCCNIIVVAGGTMRYALAKVTPWRRALPIVLLAAPLAFLGGFTPIRAETLMLVLGISLIVSAAALMLQPGKGRAHGRYIAPPIFYSIIAMLGYLAGVTGIGGGIFLAPLLHLIRWESEKRVAATASLFILVNSMAGLAGQISKNGMTTISDSVSPYWPLLIAVILGGAIGNHVGVIIRKDRAIRVITALLIGFAGFRLLFA